MKTYIVFISIIIVIYNLYISKRSIHMLQQNMYNENNRYFKWIFKNIKETFRFDLVSLIFEMTLALPAWILSFISRTTVSKKPSLE